MTSSGPARPAVAVVVPFFGDADEGAQAIAALQALATAPGDERILVDNTPQRTVARSVEPGPIRVLPAAVTASTYAARNEGAEATSAHWILFVDADCTLPEDLLDRYFEAPIEPEVGAIGGEVLGDPSQTRFIARYVQARGHLSPRLTMSGPRPLAVTANLLVRREAFAAVGGFSEGTRPSGADIEFCWRLQDAGWRLEYRERAFVWHHHRERLLPLLRQAARDGAGTAWATRRYPGASQPPSLVREMVRAVAGVAVWGAAGRFERAAFKAVDGVWVVASRIGWLSSNAAPPPAGVTDRAASVGVVAREFPTAAHEGLVDHVVRARDGGRPVRIEALARPSRGWWAPARAFPVGYGEDAGPLRRLLDLGWLGLRRPLALAREARRGTPGLTELAPVARRLTAGRARELWPADEHSRALADRLGRLLAVPVGDVVPPGRPFSAAAPPARGEARA